MDSFENKTHEQLGTASLIIGIVSIVTSFIPCIPFLGLFLGVLAIVFGSISLYQSGKSNSHGLAGLILGIVAVLIVLVQLVFIGAYFFSNRSMWQF